MASLLLALTPIALVDAASMLPIGLPVLVAFLGRPGGGWACLAFLLGIFAVYYPGGFLLALGLDATVDQLAGVFERWWSTPQGTLELTLQIAIGAALLALGWKLATRRRSRGARAAEDAKSHASPAAAFALGMGLMVVGLPGAVPYFAALDQILRAEASTAASAAALLYYNAIFLLPLALVPLARLALGARADRLFDALGRFVDRWTERVILVLLLGLGGILVVDGVGWFLGHPVLPLPPAPPGAGAWAACWPALSSP